MRINERKELASTSEKPIPGRQARSKDGQNRWKNEEKERRNERQELKEEKKRTRKNGWRFQGETQ